MRLWFLYIALTLSVAAQPNNAARSKHPFGNKGDTSAHILSAPNEQPKESQDKAGASSDTPTGHAPIERTTWWSKPDWWLLLVGSLTAGVIAWQSYETRKSAGAATGALSITKAKERGRLRMELSEPDARPTPFPNVKEATAYVVHGRLVLDGSTEVTVLSFNALARICSAIPTTQKLLSINCPSVINAQISPFPLHHVCFMDGPKITGGISQDHFVALTRREKFFVVQARIEYRDIFGDEWVYRTNQKWNYVFVPDDVLAVMNPVVHVGFWVPDGQPEENSERKRQQ